jgi:nucleoid DNA-binding protein
MIKADIVATIAKELNIKDKEALEIVDEIIVHIKDIVDEGGRLEIRDFGVFQAKARKPRIGRNPRNKKEYMIPLRRVVTFRPGKKFRDKSEDMARLVKPQQAQTAGE